MSGFDIAREAVKEDRKDIYREFWDSCPLEILKHHLAFKALRLCHIENIGKLKEELIDVANYAEKIFGRLPASKE